MTDDLTASLEALGQEAGELRVLATRLDSFAARCLTAAAPDQLGIRGQRDDFTHGCTPEALSPAAADAQGLADDARALGERMETMLSHLRTDRLEKERARREKYVGSESR